MPFTWRHWRVDLRVDRGVGIRSAEKMMKLHMVLLGFLMLLSSSYAAEEIRIISDEGTYSVCGEKEEIKLTFKNNQLSLFRLSTHGGLSFPANAGWMIYSDSSPMLWVYDGMKEIRRVEFDKDGIGFRESPSLPELWNQAPRSFIEAIRDKKEP